MNIRRLTAIAGAAMLLFAACSKDSFMQESLSVDTTDDTSYAVSLDNVQFDLFGDKQFEIALTTNSAWKIESTPGWLLIKPQQGSIGTTKLKVNVLSLNADGEDRYAEIPIVSNDSEKRELAVLKIRQPRIKFDISLDGEKQEFEWKESSKTINNPVKLHISSNMPWRIESDMNPDSLSVTPGLGEIQNASEEGTSVEILPKYPNLGKEASTIQFRIVPLREVELGKYEPFEDSALHAAEWEIPQQFLHFDTSWSEGTEMDNSGLDALLAEVDSRLDIGQQSSAVLHLDSDESWSVTSCPDWIKLSVDGSPLVSGVEKEKGEYDITLTVDKTNPDLEVRFDTLKIAPNPNELQDMGLDVNDIAKGIPVQQRPFVFNIYEYGHQDVFPQGFDFKNDDKFDDADTETYSLVLETCGPIEQLIDFSTANDYSSWLGYGFSKIEGYTYKINFYLTSQNMDLVSAIGTDTRYPVMLRPSSRYISTPVFNYPRMSFSQAKFSFDVTCPDRQGDFTLSNLPPALTGEKLTSRGFEWFNANIVSSGPWIVGPETSSWIAHDRNDGPKGGENLLFAPREANQLDNDRTNYGKLQLVSKSHLDANGGRYNGLPAGAVVEIPVNQRGFTFMATSADGGSRMRDIPAYCEDFENAAVRTVYVSCDGRWEIKASEIPSFLTPAPGSQLSGDGEDGDYHVDFIPSANTSFSEKNGSITVYCLDRNNQTDVVSVRQEAFLFDIADKSFDTPAYQATPLVAGFHLTEGAEIELTGGASWISETSGDRVGLGSSATLDLSFYEQVNTSLTDARSTNFTVRVKKPAGVSKSARFDFSQHKYLFGVSPDHVSFSEVKNIEQTIEVTSSGPFTLNTGGASWASADVTSGAGSETPVQVKISASPNYTASTKAGTITITATSLPQGDGRTIVFSVNQGGQKWGIDAEPNYIFEPLEDNNPLDFNIISSGPWQASGLGFVNMSPDHGDGAEDGSAAPVTFFPNKNLDTLSAGRSADILIKSDYYSHDSALQGAFSVYQKPFLWDVKSDYTDEIAWDSPISTEPKTFKVKSSGGWKLVSGSNDVSGSISTEGNGGSGNSWSISVDDPDSDGYQEVTITPSLNDSFDPAQAPVKVVSIEHLNAGLTMEKAFTLSQPAYALELGTGEESISVPAWNTADESADQVSPINVTSSAGWTVDIPEAAQTWISMVDKTANAAGIKIKNYTSKLDGRDAIIKLKSTVEGISLSRDITVHQDRFVLKSAEGADLSPFLAPGGDRDIPIESSATWSVTGNTNTSMVTSASNSGGKLQVSVSPYNGTEIRSSTLTLGSHGVTTDITLTQGTYTFDISGLTDNTTLSPRKNDASMSATLNSNVAWTLTIPDWMEMTNGPSSGASGNYSFGFRPVSDNETDTDREGYITFHNDVVGDIQYFVRQKGFQMGSVENLYEFEAYYASASSIQYHAISSFGWKAEANVDWIHVTPTSGPGGTTGTNDFNISVDNNGGGGRSGTITISGQSNEFGVTRTLGISQKGFVWEVPSTTSCQFVPLAASTNTNERSFTVTSSAPASINVDGGDGWLTVTHDQGSGDIPAGTPTTITLTTTDNLTTSERSADITVTSSIGSWSYILHVTQSAFVWSVSCSGANSDGKYYFHPDGTTSKTIDIQSSDGWQVLVPGGINTTASSGSGNSSVTISAPANKVSRVSGTVVVTSGMGGHSAEFEVIQDAFDPAEVIIPEFAELEAAAGSFDIVATGAWSISDKPDWITLSQTSGSGDVSGITVSAANNLEAEDKEATFHVSYTPAGFTTAMTKPIKVSQKGYVWNVSKTNFSFVPLAATPGSNQQTFQVTSSAKASVTVIDTGNGTSWLSISPSGDDVIESGVQTTVTVTAEDNTNTTERKATIRVSSKDGSHSSDIVVTQSAFVWSASCSGANNDGKYYFHPDGTTPAKTITIQSSDGWHVSVPEGINSSASSGSGSGTVTISATENTTSGISNIVTVSSDISSHEQSFTVIQDAFNPAGVTIPQFAELDAAAGSFDIIATGDWEISDAPEWITLGKYSGHGNFSGISVSPANNTGATREATFHVSYTPAGFSEPMTKEIKVSQHGFLWGITDTSHTFSDAMAETRGTHLWGFNVSSSVDATVTVEGGEWLTVSPTGLISAGLTHVDVIATNNLTAEVRSADIHVTSSAGSFTVHVTQSAFVWSASCGEAENGGNIYFSADGGEQTINISISAGASWTFQTYLNPDEFSTSYTSNSLTVTASANSSTEQKSDYWVSVKCTELGPSSACVFNLIQDGAPEPPGE